MEKIHERLKQGEMISLFPEAYISYDGEIRKFKAGVIDISKDHEKCTIIPTAISGMWGSWFSRYHNKKAMVGFPKRRSLRTKITIKFGSPLDPNKITIGELQKTIEYLRGEIK